jgi:hypothetical protein
MRSYVAEAMTSGRSGNVPDVHEAERYISELAGGREVVETDAGIFRRTDITGDGYRVFELVSLLPKTGFTVHIAKMNQ